MKSISHIFISILLVVAMLLGWSCENEMDTQLTSQQNAIKSYLGGQHKPRLIPEEEVSESLDEEPQFYTQWGLDAFRYIATYYDEGRDSRTEITKGATIKIVYSAYVFTNGAPSISALFATNDPVNIEQLQSLGLNTSYEWSSEPMEITLGKGELLSSLERAIIGCREGDSIEVYLTYVKSYGEKFIGLVPEKSSVVWFINIQSVN